MNSRTEPYRTPKALDDRRTPGAVSASGRRLTLSTCVRTKAMSLVKEVAICGKYLTALADHLRHRSTPAISRRTHRDLASPAAELSAVYVRGDVATSVWKSIEGREVGWRHGSSSVSSLASSGTRGWRSLWQTRAVRRLSGTPWSPWNSGPYGYREEVIWLELGNGLLVGLLTPAPLSRPPVLARTE